MSRRDDLHLPVRRALEKDGWLITDDPLDITFKGIRLKADLGAEKRFAAEKAGRKIAVEVKDFDGGSPIVELQKTVGQLQMYQIALSEEDPARELFLAISETIYNRYFASEAFITLVEYNKIQLLVFDDLQEVILLWLIQ
ncbi:MAG: fatty-acid synthase [Blastocatellia bacterium]|nr:fatty-acid synthase [Blastocatellia bacterium]